MAGKLSYYAVLVSFMLLASGDRSHVSIRAADETVDGDIDEDLTIVNTVDGYIHALDGKMQKLWSSSTGDPMVSARNRFPHQSQQYREHAEHRPAISNAGTAREYSVVPGIDGSILVHSVEGMRKTSVKARVLTENTPFISQEGVAYTGEKKARILGVNLASGEVVSDAGNRESNNIGHISGSGSGNNKRTSSNLRRSPSHLLLGRIDYSVRAVHGHSGTEQFNLSYSELFPLQHKLASPSALVSSTEDDIGAARSGDDLSVVSTPNGDVFFADEDGHVLYKVPVNLRSPVVSAFKVRAAASNDPEWVASDGPMTQQSPFSVSSLKVFHRMNPPHGGAESNGSKDRSLVATGSSSIPVGYDIDDEVEETLVFVQQASSLREDARRKVLHTEAEEGSADASLIYAMELQPIKYAESYQHLDSKLDAAVLSSEDFQLSSRETTATMRSRKDDSERNTDKRQGIAKHVVGQPAHLKTTARTSSIALPASALSQNNAFTKFRAGKSTFSEHAISFDRFSKPATRKMPLSVARDPQLLSDDPLRLCSSAEYADLVHMVTRQLLSIPNSLSAQTPWDSRAEERNVCVALHWMEVLALDFCAVHSPHIPAPSEILDALPASSVLLSSKHLLGHNAQAESSLDHSLARRSPKGSYRIKASSAFTDGLFDPIFTIEALKETGILPAQSTLSPAGSAHGVPDHVHAAQRIVNNELYFRGLVAAVSAGLIVISLAALLALTLLVIWIRKSRYSALLPPLPLTQQVVFILLKLLQFVMSDGKATMLSTLIDAFNEAGRSTSDNDADARARKATGDSSSSSSSRAGVDGSEVVIDEHGQPQNGSRVGSLLVLHNSVLGYGSHGTIVLKGSLNGRPVAVKRMLSQFHSAADREISLLIKSDGHPNVVRYYLREEKDDFVYLALQLCQMSLKDFIMRLRAGLRRASKAGGDARTHILAYERSGAGEQSVPTMSDEVRSSLYQIAEGLAHLHAQRIVHRDIKPHNILCALPTESAHDGHQDRKEAAVAGAAGAAVAAAGGSQPQLQSSQQPQQQQRSLSLRGLGAYVLKISDMGLSKQLDKDEHSFSSMSLSYALMDSKVRDQLSNAMKMQHGATPRLGENGSDSGGGGGGGGSCSSSAATVAVEHSPVGTIGWQAPELMQQRRGGGEVVEGVDGEEEEDENSATTAGSETVEDAGYESDNESEIEGRENEKTVNVNNANPIVSSSSRNANGNNRDNKKLPSDQHDAEELREQHSSLVHSSSSTSTTGGVVSDIERIRQQLRDRRRQRKRTQIVDVFSLGCVFHYVLTVGNHPFGEWYEREANIMNSKVDLSALDHWPDAIDLIKRMLHFDPLERPTAGQVCQHPFFWAAGKRLEFLVEFSDRLEQESAGSALILAVESNATSITSSRWDRKLDHELVSDMGKYRKYDTSSIRDLLRVVRNKRHHYHELSPAMKKVIGTLPEGFSHYFEARFPNLLLHCYRIAQLHLQTEKLFSTWFPSRSSNSQPSRISQPSQTAVPPHPDAAGRGKPVSAAQVSLLSADADVVSPIASSLVDSSYRTPHRAEPWSAEDTAVNSAPLSSVSVASAADTAGAAIVPSSAPLRSDQAERAGAAVRADENESKNDSSDIAHKIPPRPDSILASEDTAGIGLDIAHGVSNVVLWQGSSIAATFSSSGRGWWRAHTDWEESALRTAASSSTMRKSRPSHLAKSASDMKYRTRLCTHWEANAGSSCPMRKKGKCIFAHGPLELRVKETRRDKWGKSTNPAACTGAVPTAAAAIGGAPPGGASSMQHPVVAGHGHEDQRSSGGEDVLGAARSIEKVRKAEGSIGYFEKSSNGADGGFSFEASGVNGHGHSHTNSAGGPSKGGQAGSFSSTPRKLNGRHR